MKILRRDLQLMRKRLTLIPPVFKGIRVVGTVNLNSNRLKTLENSPSVVDGNFLCYYNYSLKSLEGGPVKVGGVYECSECALTSLRGAPEYVGRFICDNSKSLTSLEGGPKRVDRDFDCSHCRLLSLEGAPAEVGGDFDCSNNPGRFTEEDVRAVCQVGGKIYV